MALVLPRVYIDTNIAIEFHPLDTWDWAGLVGGKPDLFVCLPVHRELDSFKKHRSTGKRRRAITFLEVLAEVPAYQPLDKGSYRLNVRLEGLHPNQRTFLNMPTPETRDEELVDCAVSMFAFGMGAPNYLLTDDAAMVSLAKNHLTRLNAKILRAPKKYRLDSMAGRGGED
ncbi:MAG: PIN domain-containing protein [Fimbriimonadaceae bacterium]